MSKENNKIATSIFWQGLERVGSYGIGFIVSVILANKLPVEDFGVVAIMTVFVTLSNVFIDSGFSTALIQKKDMEDADCCSVFYINIVMAVILYAALFLTSPLIETFYEADGLAKYLHVFSFVLIIRSFSIVQAALLRKRMLFHLSFRISWVALLISGAVGIAMAYSECGVWSLVAQQIVYSLVTVAMQWLLVKWRPKRIFNWERTKELFRFGWKMFCSSFLDTVYHELYSIIIGKIADLKVLSYYDRGKMYPKFGMDVINSTIGGVMLPAFSEIQDDRPKLKELTRRSLKNTMFIVTPALAFLFVFAREIIMILLPEEWLPSVIFVRLCCITFFFWPFHTLNLHVITACGRSDVHLTLEIIKKVQAVVVIAITYRFGVVTMVAAGAAMGFVSMIENAWYNGKLIGYPPWQQLWNVAPIVLATAAVSAASYFIAMPLHGVWPKFLVGGTAFGVLFLVVTFAMRIVPQEILTVIKNRRL